MKGLKKFETCPSISRTVSAAYKKRAKNIGKKAKSHLGPSAGLMAPFVPMSPRKKGSFLRHGHGENLLVVRLGESN